MLLGQIWSRRIRRIQAQGTFVTNMSIVLDNKISMLCDKFGIVEPAHACCTPYLAVYSHIVLSHWGSVGDDGKLHHGKNSKQLFETTMVRLESLLAPLLAPRTISVVD